MKRILAAFFSIFLISSIHSQEKTSTKEDSGTNKAKELLFSTINFVKTGPYSLNFGCEPSINKGSVTFGSLEYKWKPDFSSQIYFEKENDFSVDYELNPEYGHYTYNTDFKCNSFKIFPYKKYFRNEENHHNFSLSLGATFESADVVIKTTGILNNSVYGEQLNLSNKYFGIFKANERQKYIIVGPCIDLSYTIPITAWLSFRTENSFIPLYYYRSNITHYYTYVNTFRNSEDSLTVSSMNSGIAKLKCHLDLFKKFALVANYEFSRFSEFKTYYNAFENLEAEKYTRTINTFRAGVAMLESTDTYVRIQTGFYREFIWTSISNSGTDFSQKWVLSVSVGF